MWTAESSPMAFPNSINEMSISPGFTKHITSKVEKGLDGGNK